MRYIIIFAVLFCGYCGSENNYPDEPVILNTNEILCPNYSQYSIIHGTVSDSMLIEGALVRTYIGIKPFSDSTDEFGHFMFVFHITRPETMDVGTIDCLGRTQFKWIVLQPHSSEYVELKLD